MPSINSARYAQRIIQTESHESPSFLRKVHRLDPPKRVNTFTYLGSTLAEDGELDAKVTHRVQSGWKNWKRVSGVLYDRKINVKIKGKVYRTVVRPTLMYWAKTWALKMAHENKLESQK